METISDGCVLLDALQLIAEGYTRHIPICSHRHPAHLAPPAARNTPGPANPSDEHEELHPCQCMPQPAGLGSKKRKRRSKYQPNAREQEAAERASRAVPALEAAMSSLQRWMAARQLTSLQGLMLGPSTALTCNTACPSTVGPEPISCHGHSLPQRQPSSKGSAGTDPEQKSGLDVTCGGSPAGTDYLAIAAMRHALRPKFEWAEPGAELSASSPAAQYNLFGQLVCNARESEGVGLAAGHEVLIPAKSAFLMSDIRQLEPLVQAAATCGGFHCVVLDPPWENKSAHRGSKYPTLPSRNLLSLPLPALVTPASCPSSNSSDGARGGDTGIGCETVGQFAHGGATADRGRQATASSARNAAGDEGSRHSSAAAGCLVALWVTNRERHRRFIEQELLPAWGLHHVATWWWLKVTPKGQPVSRLDSAHRRPFEPLLICRPLSTSQPAGSPGPLHQMASNPETEAAKQYPADNAVGHGAPMQMAGDNACTPSAPPAAAAMQGEGASVPPPLGQLQPQQQEPAEDTAAGVPGAAMQSEGTSEPKPLGQDTPEQQQEPAGLSVAGVPDGLVLLSVPLEHSRKPHLGPLLRQYLPPNARCLEMFAREMFPGWTSWGNEVLKFQGLENFEDNFELLWEQPSAQ